MDTELRASFDKLDNVYKSYRIDSPRLDLAGEGVHESGGDDAGAAARLVAHGLGPGQLEGVAQVAQQARRRREGRGVNWRTMGLHFVRVPF